MSAPVVLDGRVVARDVEEKVKAILADIKEKTGKTPVLATIIVGEDPASVTYVRMKCNACLRVGIVPRKIELKDSTTTEELLDLIAELNGDKDVCGILIQHPLPAQIDENACFNAISPQKDVDGLSVYSYGSIALGERAYNCATPSAIMEILRYYNVPLVGKEAVVIGRSRILGRPVSMLLVNADCTVTVCHSKTTNIADVVRRADIVVACVGIPEFVKKEWIKPGAILIDAGYNEGNIGDIDLKNAASVSSMYTPVPGGVGPCTIAMLLYQTALAGSELLCR